MQPKKLPFTLLYSWCILAACNAPENVIEQSSAQPDDTIITVTSQKNIEDASQPAEASTVASMPAKITTDSIPQQIITTRDVSPESLVNFARTLIGIPYKYASIDPADGFDCSGFITYVFNHFNIKVPRSSIDFTNAGMEVPVDNAKPGDLILFTGTDSTKRFVGHMGIINHRNIDSTTFIHSSSGKTYGVTVTPLNNYYKGRFVKVIRIFPDNEQ